MISVSEVSKQFGPLTVLRGITLEVRRGEVSVLLGPSGGGKSTFLRTINGLETFDSGEIRIGELRLGPRHDPSREAALSQIRRRVGMVFQQFNLFPHLTVMQNVTEAPLRVLGVGRDQAVADAERLLDRVGMLAKRDSLPGQLSGGQQQRVAIARTLAMSPEAILFDEPTSALDPRMTAEVTSVMTELAQAGQTMIVVTHAMSFARNVAHTVHILHEGRVAESGPPIQVFEQPQHHVTRTFLADANST